MAEKTIVHVRIIVNSWKTYPPLSFLITELTVDFPKWFVACVVCTCIFAKSMYHNLEKKMFFSSQVLKEK